MVVLSYKTLREGRSTVARAKRSSAAGHPRQFGSSQIRVMTHPVRAEVSEHEVSKHEVSKHEVSKDEVSKDGQRRSPFDTSGRTAPRRHTITLIYDEPTIL